MYPSALNGHPEMLSFLWLNAVLVLAPFVLAVRMERAAAQGDTEAPDGDVADLVRRIPQWPGPTPFFSARTSIR